MKDAAKAPAMVFESVTILLDIENERHTSFALKLIGEGSEVVAAASCSDTTKISESIKKAPKVLEDLNAKYEKNMAESRGQDPDTV